MSRYRIIERDIAFFAPQVRNGLFWKYLDDIGRELPWGTVWSGPLEMAAAGVRAHQKLKYDESADSF
jgi:hypothetical protein